jgi:hypothetical protein
MKVWQHETCGGEHFERNKPSSGNRSCNWLCKGNIHSSPECKKFPAVRSANKHASKTFFDCIIKLHFDACDFAFLKLEKQGKKHVQQN